jgi:AcrR family transcriptional regulator
MQVSRLHPEPIGSELTSKRVCHSGIGSSSEGKEIMDLESESVHARIIDQATDLFAVHGFSGVSMREIAEACELSKAGLYYHFKDKEDLFMSILMENMAALNRLMMAMADVSGSAQEKVTYFAHGIFSQLKGNQRTLIRLASQDLRNLSPGLHAEFYQHYEAAFLAPLDRIFEQGMAENQIRSLKPRIATWTLLGVLYPFLDSKMDKNTLDGMLEDILQLFFHGVVKSESSTS